MFERLLRGSIRQSNKVFQSQNYRQKIHLLKQKCCCKPQTLGRKREINPILSLRFSTRAQALRVKHQMTKGWCLWKRDRQRCLILQPKQLLTIYFLQFPVGNSPCGSVWP